MSSQNILILVIVLLLLFGSLPVYPHSRRWGYAPSGLLVVVLIVFLLLRVF
jgi:hypothetical protein